MKIDIMSDVHLEFGSYKITNKNRSDVLVLAGDICVIRELAHGSFISSKITDFFEMASKKYKNVVYVMGNHEHYNGEITESARIFKDKIGQFKNIHLLDNSSIAIGDVTFMGGTLWTNFNFDPDAMKTIARMLNDYRQIKYDGNKFTPELSVIQHCETLDYLKRVIKAFHKAVVVTHHSPSFKNIAPKYANEPVINSAYHSNLDEFILDNPQILAWISGHTHTAFDHYLGDTRLVCNPRGYYGYEETAINYKQKTIEL